MSYDRALALMEKVTLVKEDIFQPYSREEWFGRAGASKNSDGTYTYKGRKLDLEKIEKFFGERTPKDLDWMLKIKNR